MTDTDMTAVSLFDGIGGFPLALSRAGIRTVATVEIDKAAAGVAAGHFPQAKHLTDVTEVTADDLLPAGFVPERGIITGGWPCQDLSLAGCRLGLGGARSGLFWEIVRLARDLRPRWLLLENVPGLLSAVCSCPGLGVCGASCTDPHPVRGGACGPGRCMELHGGAMGAVLGALGDLGYGLAYRVLDAQYFGVPQRRRRVVIVGCLGDWTAPAQVLLEPEGREGGPATGLQPRAGVARITALGADEPRSIVNALTSNMAGGGGGADDNTAQGGHLISSLVGALPTVQAHHGRNSPGQDVLIPVGAEVYQGHGSNVGPLGTLRAGSGSVSGGLPFVSDPSAVFGSVTHALTAEGSDASEDGTGRGTPLVALAIREASRYPNPEATLSVSADAVRRLTPVECERLQGYPDGWTATSNGKTQDDSPRYRQLGNSIAVPVFEWVARRVAAYDARGAS